MITNTMVLSRLTHHHKWARSRCVPISYFYSKLKRHGISVVGDTNIMEVRTSQSFYVILSHSIRLSFCISVSVIHKALVTYPLSLVSLRIAAGLPRFCIHMYPICIYSPCMSPFFDKNYGSKSEGIFCWYGGIAQEMRVTRLTATTFCKLQRKRLR